MLVIPTMHYNVTLDVRIWGGPFLQPCATRCQILGDHSMEWAHSQDLTLLYIAVCIPLGLF